MADYTPTELREALARTGISAGDSVYCHSNIGVYGLPEGIAGKDALCQLYFDALMELIGPTGTLIVPTYTYSFSTGGRPYDPDATGSNMGIFAEWVRRHPNRVRSLDPCFSVAAIGPKARWYCDDLPPNSFAPDSTFGRLRRDGGKILCLNHPGCTFLHYVERELDVPYRFDKKFVGEIHQGGKVTTLEWEIYVRYMSDDLLAHDPWNFVAAIKERGIARWHNFARGEILAISAEDVFQTVATEYARNPWFLTKAYDADRLPVIDTASRGSGGIQPTSPRA